MNCSTWQSAKWVLYFPTSCTLQINYLLLIILPNFSAPIIYNVHLCTCMCVHACVCMHVCACICVHASVYMHVCACICVHACVYMHVCTCICVHACVYMHVCACMCVHACVYMHVCTCMCVHASVYMHVCTCMCVHACVYMHVCLQENRLLYVLGGQRGKDQLRWARWCHCDVIRRHGYWFVSWLIHTPHSDMVMYDLQSDITTVLADGVASQSTYVFQFAILSKKMTFCFKCCVHSCCSPCVWLHCENSSQIRQVWDMSLCRKYWSNDPLPQHVHLPPAESESAGGEGEPPGLQECLQLSMDLPF